MSLAKTVGRVAARYGAAYTVRALTLGAGANAWTAGAETVVYRPCVGRGRFYKPEELKGSIREHDTKIVIDAASLGAAPKSGDRIALGTFTADAGAEWLQIVAVDTPREAGAARVYVLQARG